MKERTRENNEKVIRKDFRKKYGWKFFMILSFGGFLICAPIIFYLKSSGLYDYDKDSTKKVIFLFIFGLVLYPLGAGVLLLFLERIFFPFIRNMSAHLIKRRPAKVVSRETLRKRRIMKVLSPFYNALGLTMFISMFLSFIVSLILMRIVYNLFFPEETFEENMFSTTLFIIFFAVMIFLTFFTSAAICTRFFIRKKGELKALKYIIELKKSPGCFGSLWLRLCGLDPSTVREYLNQASKGKT